MFINNIHVIPIVVNISGRTRDLPVPAHGVSTRAGGLRPRRVAGALALARTSVLPSRGSMLRPCVPLSTLRREPCGSRRMTRGHRGWLGLRCETLSFSTPCRF
jgi:hypothetical protein